MPEGPEVRRYADLLAAALDGDEIVSLTARTRRARAWLEANPGLLTGRRILRVRARGKNLVGTVDGGHFWYSHLLMWGRWQVLPASPAPEWDRRERARIVTARTAALLYSAPIFEAGMGDPFTLFEPLVTLGPDALPYPDEPPFDEAEFRRRLLSPPNQERTVGAALLDQRIVAGLGNYLRAEILFVCRLDPWRRVADLGAADLDLLGRVIPVVTARAYATGGTTVPDAEQRRMQSDASLVYQPGREYGTRHYVFRRTNLPCLACGTPIRQQRQYTHHDDNDEERTRIVYYCPVCQDATPST